MNDQDGGYLGHEESEELGDYAPGGCLGGGVRDYPEGSGTLVAEAVASPQPIFLTLCDPNSNTAVTVALPFGIAVTVSHTLRGAAVADIRSAFPSPGEPESSDEPVTGD